MNVRDPCFSEEKPPSKRGDATQRSNSRWVEDEGVSGRAASMVVPSAKRQPETQIPVDWSI